jgi:DNA-binding transcriptional MerR regulator
MATDRPADAFRTISEVAEDLDLPQHVLRFWETRFSQIKPLKRGGGRRYYRPDDIELLRTIRHLLYGEGYTIRGVQRIFKEQGVKTVIAVVRDGGRPKAVAAEPEPMPAAYAAPAMDDLGEAIRIPQVEIDPIDAPVHFDEFARQPGLGAADHARLEAVLAEIAECTRILRAARA